MYKGQWRKQLASINGTPLSGKQVILFVSGFFFGWGLFMFASGIFVGLAING